MCLWYFSSLKRELLLMLAYSSLTSLSDGKIAFFVFTHVMQLINNLCVRVWAGFFFSITDDWDQNIILEVCKKGKYIIM